LSCSVLTNFPMIPPYFRLFLNVCMRILGSGHGSMLVCRLRGWHRGPPDPSGSPCWLPLVNVGGCHSSGCRFPCLMRRQPQSSRTLVVSGHNWPPHVDGKFAYVHAAPSLKKKSWYGFTDAILHILICISTETNTCMDLQTLRKNSYGHLMTVTREPRKQTRPIQPFFELMQTCNPLRFTLHTCNLPPAT